MTENETSEQTNLAEKQQSKTTIKVVKKSKRGNIANFGDKLQHTGRPKGVKNKITTILKDDILASYNHRGGVKFLNRLESKLFVSLVERVIPREIAQDIRITGAELITTIRVLPVESPRLPAPEPLVIDVIPLALGSSVAEIVEPGVNVEAESAAKDG